MNLLPNGYKFNYSGFIPLLIEAVKEQNHVIEEQEQRLTNLEDELARLKATIAGNKTKSASLTGNQQPATSNQQPGTSNPELFQNNPNPFTESTEIKYQLPESVNSAILYIYDMNGKQIRNMSLDQTGRGSVTIQGGELDAGMYMYTLIVDGQAVGTKQMILTD